MTKKYPKKLDTLWRTKGKEDARCEVCESLPRSRRVVYNLVYAHHVIGRRNRTLRWDLRNRVWLCFSHHVGASKSAHNDPVWFWEWMAENKPEDTVYIYKKRNEISKFKKADYKRMLIELGR